MANKAVPKWKRYRELQKGVNEHVLGICNTEQCQGDEGLSLSSDGRDSELAENNLYVESSASFHGPNILQDFSISELWVYSSFSAAAMFEVHTNDVSEIDDNWQQAVENAEETLLDGNLHVSSSESETDGSDENENLALNLATWATKFGVSHSAVNELLCILRQFHGFFYQKMQEFFWKL